MALKIPFEKIPQVSILDVTTCSQISLSQLRELADGDPIHLQPSSLREIRLHSCPNMDVGDLRQTIASLKDVGAWDTLNRVVIEKCDLLDYDSTVGVIGKERLYFTRS